MNPQDPQDLEQRLRQLEADLDSTPGSVAPSPSRAPTNQSMFQQILIWFRGLPQGGQIIVACMAVLAILAVFSAVFQLLFLAIRLAVLVGILYLVYKVFFASQSPLPPK